MKITYFETWQNGVQLLGSDYTSIIKNMDTQRKLNNSINKHLKKIKSTKIKGNFEIKYNSVYN